MRERRRSFIQTCFREKCDFRLKQNYERTAKYVHTNVFREKCEFRFKQNYERTAKYVHTNLLLKNVWKIGSNKVMSER